MQWPYSTKFWRGFVPFYILIYIQYIYKKSSCKHKYINLYWDGQVFNDSPPAMLPYSIKVVGFCALFKLLHMLDTQE